MVSMKEIAKKCNVSVASVSKALNGYSDISEETRKMILKTASEMGYLPNSSARTLKTKRSYNIGVMFVDEAASGLPAGLPMIILIMCWRALRGLQRKEGTILPSQAERFPDRN